MEQLIFALEGIGGCGKSHVGHQLSKAIHDENYSVFFHKIGGLGKSHKVQQLKKIMDYRHQLMLNGLETSKYVEDRKKEKIFRLAMKFQYRLFLQEFTDSYKLAILDRTPLMIWVFAIANNPNNPYLKEIHDDVILYTKKLNLTTIFFLDVEPETAYSRMIVRYCSPDKDNKKMISNACKNINASSLSTKKIKTKVHDLLQSPKTVFGKEFEAWDFIPMNVTHRERKFHIEILEFCKNHFGINYKVINAEQSVEGIVSEIKESIESEFSTH